RLRRGIGKQPEIHVHRLKGLFVGAAGDVRDEGAQRRGWRRRRCVASCQLGAREPSGKKADGGALDIALDTGDLAGEAQRRPQLQPQLAVEQARRVDEGVAMQSSKSRECRVLEARDRTEDAALLAMLQLGLEA